VPAFRRPHPAFRRRRWFEGQALPGGDERDIASFTPGGQEMSEQDWSAGFTKSLMMFLDGRFPASRGPWGRKFLMRLEP
jgi:glycogen operon protein